MLNKSHKSHKHHANTYSIMHVFNYAFEFANVCFPVVDHSDNGAHRVTVQIVEEAPGIIFCVGHALFGEDMAVHIPGTK